MNTVERMVWMVRRLSGFYEESMRDAGLSDLQINAVIDGVMHRQMTDVVLGVDLEESPE